MQIPFAYAFVIPLATALTFVVVGILGDRLPKGGGWLAVVAEGVALVWGLWIAIAEMGSAVPYHDVSFVWLGLPNGTNFIMGTMVSPLGALMLIVVNVVGFLVVLYSIEYMGHEEGLPRYFAELMLFLTAMNMVVLADNYLEFVLFWELVGLCSYLLIGFFWKKPEAASAAKKAFLVTRIGDVMFFVGIFVFFTAFAGLKVGDIGSAVPGFSVFGTACPGANGIPYSPPSWACDGFAFVLPNANSAAPLIGPAQVAAFASSSASNMALMTIGGLMILGGAAGKSAQFPLHTWLPDAMEGPTTVSALIHAATMVAAGIYLLAVTSIFLGFTVSAALLVLAVGGFTSLFAGTMGLVASDIKRVIAYSTMSQLGYMTMAVGAAALVPATAPGAAMFQLFTHAFFKALLFLCAGAVIHALGTQDLFKMGGLRKAMPITSACMLVGALALSGIPPFAGFFSKDDLLGLTYQAAQAYPVVYVFFAMALIGVFLTALYIFRLWFLTFSGEKLRSAPSDAHASSSPVHAPLPASAASAHAATPPAAPSHSAGAHEPSWFMLGPLVTLAALSVVAGFLPLLPSHISIFPGLTWSAAGYSPSASFSATDLGLTLVSLGLASAGIGTAWLYWGNGKVYHLPEGSPLKSVQTVLVRKYYFDEVYDGFAEGAILTLARAMDWVDRYVIDGTVHGMEELFSQVSVRGRRIQTGLVSSYAQWIVIGLLLLVIFFLYGVPHLAPYWTTGGG